MSFFPKKSDVTESKYLKKEDIPQGGVVVEIAGFDQHNVAQESQPEEIKVLMLFDVAGMKPLVLNSTNYNICEMAFGEDSQRWVGQRVKLYVDPNISFGGKIVGGIRIRTPSKPTPAPVVAQPKVDDFDDDIPF